MPRPDPGNATATIASMDPARIGQPLKADPRVHDDRWHEIRRFDAKQSLHDYPFHCIVLRTTGTKTMMKHARVGTELRIGDLVVTSADCVVALAFTIGGRVALTRSTTVAITGERTVSSDGLMIGRLLRKVGALWIKADDPIFREPLQIQTNGGVMGIKG